MGYWMQPIKLNLQQGRSLKEFSTFGIGGAIRFFAEVFSVSEMEEAFHWIRQENLPFFLIGKGSNCLFDDKGFDGLVLLNRIDGCQWHLPYVTVGSGYSFSLLGTQAARKGFSGLEFACGIPATVGGAVFMNAGASGSETFTSLVSVEFLHLDGRIVQYSKQDLAFDYRFSSFQEMQGAILSATFALQPSPQARASQLAILSKRIETQPYQDKNIGCIFRNPRPSTPAGLLIDRCGLKGLRVGGAQVSSLHANFIVNAANATSKDVIELIQLVQRRVLEQTGEHLQPEIRILDVLGNCVKK